VCVCGRGRRLCVWSARDFIVLTQSENYSDLPRIFVVSAY